MDPPGRPGYPFGTHPRGATLTYYTVVSTLMSPICGVTGATLGRLLEETAGPQCTCGCSAGPAAGTTGHHEEHKLPLMTGLYPSLRGVGPPLNDQYPVPAGRYLEHPLSTRQRVPGAGAGVQFLGKKKTDTQPGTRPWFGRRYEPCHGQQHQEELQSPRITIQLIKPQHSFPIPNSSPTQTASKKIYSCRRF
ncbi:hypothetical protein PCASD_24304 [Puccinia coronata f. sp. avenae]|uniref:Uncharacterized protein n=1 Tax=Puccinia coronata f. sp. avenae TaxID=200324 RepID=A0A2N5S9C5_9BASI|nr:hypothetical protein PCASD_24304 [Puccinia coronata f. sp. avenae]